MPDLDANGPPHDPPAAYEPDVNNIARAYALKGRVGFLPGNPGKPKGSGQKAKHANDIIDAAGLEPLAVKMEQLKRLRAKIERGVWRSDYEELETEKLLDSVTRDVMQYRHQRLKSVESHTQIELVQKLQSLEGRSDEELRELLAQAQELAQLPPGKS